ncbi:hypothetical protein BGZ96_005382, partial [Linnemannia gamsii]
MLIYDTVVTIWRPLSRGRYLVYELAEVLSHLELSRSKLTTLGIVSKNDYSSNLKRLGVITNHKIVKSLEETEAADVEKLVQQYLLHPDVVCKKPSATHFQAPIKVFVHRQLTAPDSTMPPQSPDQEAATQDGAQQCGSLKHVLERLEVLRMKLRENKTGTTDSDQGEKPKDVFNRYSTVDRPPERRPRPHDSGRPFKHRERFAIKTRSQLKKHDRPETMKQHKLKPWKSPPESPLVPSTKISPPKATPKKQRNVETMDKKELVKAMQWDHPTRTLNIGTINANAARALNKGIDQGIAPTYLSAIKKSLRDVTRISSRVKRTAQRAIGQYIERLSMDSIDESDDNNNNTTTNITEATDTTNAKTLREVDRILLNILCPAFSNKDL